MTVAADRGPRTEEELEQELARPTPELVADLAALDGDILVLGAGGKMGPSLAHLAAEALRQAGGHRQVIAVARFRSPGLRERLASWGVRTIAADLTDEQAVQALPEAANVIFMVGQKFGTQGAEAATWAMNAYVPGRVAERFRGARWVVFSSGNVYPLVPVVRGGADERQPPQPIGEYAQSVLGRERVFEHFSRRYGTPGVVMRLNYAVELRYGVVVDVALAVWRQQPIDLRMGAVNVIWQGDANTFALRALRLAGSPPRILNVTGPETVSVRWLAERLGELLDRRPQLVGEEAETALLSNAAEAFAQFGYPRVPLGRVLRWTAQWLQAGGPLLDRPTHFQERSGRF